MEKARVNKGERYWYVRLDDEDNGISVPFDFDDYSDIHDVRNRIGNYFYTKEEAEAVAKKLFAVLKDADVIEMPSDEELEIIAELEYPTGTDCYLRAKGIKLAQAAFNSGVNWLKSKIVK